MATVAALRRDVDQAESMILKSELAQRKRVLRRLGYLESGGTVTTKGHVRTCTAMRLGLAQGKVIRPRILHCVAAQLLGSCMCVAGYRTYKRWHERVDRGASFAGVP